MLLNKRVHILPVMLLLCQREKQLKWAHPSLLSLPFLKMPNQMSNSGSQFHIFIAGWSYLIGVTAAKYWDYRVWKSSQRLERCLEHRR